MPYRNKTCCSQISHFMLLREGRSCMSIQIPVAPLFAGIGGPMALGLPLFAEQMEEVVERSEDVGECTCLNFPSPKTGIGGCLIPLYQNWERGRAFSLISPLPKLGKGAGSEGSPFLI